MLKNTKVLTVAFIGLGMLLGYAAASGKLNPAQWLRADQTGPTGAATSPSNSTERPSGCCGDGLNKDEIVALVAHNQKVAAETEKSGRKPNICIIWGDD